MSDNALVVEEMGFARQRGQPGYGMHANLRGDRGAVQLHGAYVDAERRRDLLVHLSVHDVFQDFTLAMSEPGESAFELLQPGTHSALGGIQLERQPDRRE